MNGIDSDTHFAIGAIFKANRTGQAGRQLPVALAFSGSCANSALADQVCNVLRTDQVKKFRTRGQSEFIDVE
jgi:hypothetical protein